MNLSVRVFSACVIVGVLTTGLFAQDVDSSASAVTFSVTVLQVEQPGNSDLAVSGDTVMFRLYYVDIACTRFEYFFKQEGATLTIHRLTLPPDSCDRESETLYGVEGRITGVAPGKHLLELRSMVGGRDELLYHDVVVVKRKVAPGGTKARATSR